MKHAYYLSSIICYLLLLLGCSHDPLLQRAGTNYFPFAEENTWVYFQSDSEDTITLKVMGTEPLFQKEAWVLERNGYPEYWWESTRRIDKFYCETIFVNGEEDTIITCWIPWLHFPFVLDDMKDYTFEEKKCILEDTILTIIQVKYAVIALKSDDYQIRVKLIKSRSSNNFGTYCDTTIYYEWYRQDVGMTERTFNNTQENLIEYSIP